MDKLITGSDLVKSKVAFLKSTENAAGIGPFFYSALIILMKNYSILIFLTHFRVDNL